MNKFKELEQQLQQKDIKIQTLEQQLEEFRKAIPIICYDKDPSIGNQAKKEYLNKYGFAKSIYFFFSKKALDGFFNGLVFTLLMKLFDIIKSKFF